MNDLVPKLFCFVEIVCFASLPHPVSVGGVMQDASLTKRHQAKMTLPALSDDVLLIAKLLC